MSAAITGSTKTTSRRRRAGRRARLVIVIAAASLVAAAGAAEAVARTVLTHKISSAAGRALSASHVDAGIGATPALADIISGQIPQVSIKAGPTNLCQLPLVGVSATLHGLSTASHGSRGPTVNSIDATISLSAATIAGAVARGSGGREAPAVTPDPAHGLLDLSVGPAGLIEVAERPELHGQQISFVTESVSVGGRPAPDGLAQRFTAGSGTAGRDLGHLPLNLTATAATVTSTGLSVTLHGGPATLHRAGRAC